MSLDLTEDISILVQVMAWCHQATSHYLSQYWPRSLSPYDVTKPQYVTTNNNSILYMCIFFVLRVQYIHSGAESHDTNRQTINSLSQTFTTIQYYKLVNEHSITQHDILVQQICRKMNPLTHCGLGDFNKILDEYFSSQLQWLMAEIPAVKLLFDECH